MSTRLRLSCRALLIIVLVRPNFYSALCLATVNVQFSSPFTLMNVYGLRALAFLYILGYKTNWRSQKFNESRDPYTDNNLIDYYTLLP